MFDDPPCPRVFFQRNLRGMQLNRSEPVDFGNISSLHFKVTLMQILTA
jgi:hypothetical protein